MFSPENENQEKEISEFSEIEELKLKSFLLNHVINQKDKEIKSRKRKNKNYHAVIKLKSDHIRKQDEHIEDLINDRKILFDLLDKYNVSDVDKIITMENLKG